MIELLEEDMRGLEGEEFSEAFLLEAKAWIAKWGWGFTIVMVIVWPVLSLPAGVFNKDYWAFWVFLSLSWAFVATFVIIALPLYESMDAITGVSLWMIGKPRAKEVPDTPQQPA